VKVKVAARQESAEASGAVAQAQRRAEQPDVAQRLGEVAQELPRGGIDLL